VQTQIEASILLLTTELDEKLERIGSDDFAVTRAIELRKERHKLNQVLDGYYDPNLFGDRGERPLNPYRRLKPKVGR
jgi:hypothetical protein